MSDHPKPEPRLPVEPTKGPGRWRYEYHHKGGIKEPLAVWRKRVREGGDPGPPPQPVDPPKV